MTTRIRNRKKTTGYLNRILKSVLIFLVCVGCLGTSIVYLRHQRSEAANNIRKLERDISVERRKVAELGAQLSSAMATNKLIKKNRQYSLGLAKPREHQIVRVSSNVESRLLRKTSGGLLSANFAAGN
ncbi:hypothetical protein MLD52_08860 [Puniceicoccaceae bacterium K14]|nr:hypothetical protein [Puniceicoccaceae bacterium K14]